MLLQRSPLYKGQLMEMGMGLPSVKSSCRFVFNIGGGVV